MQNLLLFSDTFINPFLYFCKNRSMITLGITGTLGAGKGTIVDYLVRNKGYAHYSVRGFLLHEIKRRKLPENRDSMVEVANDLRSRFGPAYIVEKLYDEAVKSGKNAIIESIRTTGEIESLRSKGLFFLLAVDADVEIRFNRILQRGSETDNVDYQTFIANENREMAGKDPGKQNLLKCLELADYALDNNGTFQQLYNQVEIYLSEIAEKSAAFDKGIVYQRPSWDEYFMEIASTVAKRATCDRGRSGCVIVRDKHLLVTGYVGSPMGLVHCDEVGHLFKKTIHEDGHITQHCVRTVHAEQNAITQAARYGIPLEGSTLYCRMTPCRTCAMLIINCGIKRVVCEYRYHAGSESEAMFEEAGIELSYFNDEVLKYDNQA